MINSLPTPFPQRHNYTRALSLISKWILPWERILWTNCLLGDCEVLQSQNTLNSFYLQPESNTDTLQAPGFSYINSYYMGYKLKLNISLWVKWLIPPVWDNQEAQFYLVLWKSNRQYPRKLWQMLLSEQVTAVPLYCLWRSMHLFPVNRENKTKQFDRIISA